MAPAARVLAEAAVEVLGESQAGTAEAGALQGGSRGGGQGGLHGGAHAPSTSVSLRIVLNPASMGKDVAAVEAAVEEVLLGA